MTQITSGIRSLLSIPLIYTLYQKIVFPRHKLINDYIKPALGQKILDIGCGTGNILNYLPDTSYFGIDTSPEYIETAKKCFQHRGEFKHISVHDFKVEGLSGFDTALSIGVLHHISDEDGIKVLSIAKSALKPGGRFIAVEPVYCDDQSRLAKWIISKDRGQNVKDKKGYMELSQKVFSTVNFYIRHDLLRIPYTLIIIEGIA